MTWTPSTPKGSGTPSYQRSLGDSEYAFHVFSHTGVGDMFLHLAFTAPRDLMDPERVLLAWATILARHPLLLASVVSVPVPGAAAEPQFRFLPPGNVDALLACARQRTTFAQCTKPEFIDRYMNGNERLLSDECISHLTIAQSPASTPAPPPSSSSPPSAASSSTQTSFAAIPNGHQAYLGAGSQKNGIAQEAHPESAGSSTCDTDRASYDLYLCAPHFAGDAMPLHQSAHDLLAVLGAPAPSTPVPGHQSHRDIRAMREILQEELDAAAGAWAERLPLPVESLLPAPPSQRLARAAAQVNYLQAQEREVGGHVLPRKQKGPMKTVLLELGLSKDQTRKVLSRCKGHGVSANHAVFAIVDIAWAKMIKSGFDLPIMNYTALSLRPYLTFPSPQLEKQMSYWFVALTYFNIVLPSFLPRSITCAGSGSESNLESAFWHRTRTARTQIAHITRSKFLVHRARIMASQRAERSGRKYASEAPRASETAVMPSNSPNPAPVLALRPPPSDALAAISPRVEPVPSKALMGISLMGNLDKVYDAKQYPEIQLADAATASRLKAGGILFLAHTFAGRLWLHLAYDANGFEEGTMERFWGEVGRTAQELLVGE